MEYNIIELQKELEHHLTLKRFQHTIGVRYTAAALAMKYGYHIEKAEAAGLLHDCAKCLSDKQILDKCIDFGIEITEVERRNPYLLHAKLGASFAKRKYHITDTEILEAVVCHTTGKPNMNVLEKIIFIADYIEPNRKYRVGLDEIRKVAFENMDEAIFMILKSTLDFLKNQKDKKEIDSMTIEAYRYYKDKKFDSK